MLKQYFNPVRFVFEKDAIKNVSREVKHYGTRCLVVMQDNNPVMLDIKNKVADCFNEQGINADFFTEIRPNPLISDIEKGIQIIHQNNYDAVVAIGGGSVIDTAKLLSISNQYEIDWKIIHEMQPMLENHHKLPLIAMPTTAGTGSHCTPAAVVSDEQSVKHTIYSYDFFPSTALIDSTLTMSLPQSLTASTGFDAFSHLSESYINGNLAPIPEVLCLDAMKKIVQTLPALMNENKAEYREIMSYADSCAGICLSNGGAIVPHAFGEVISSSAYRVNHGCSLALVYPSFVEHFYHHPIYGERVKKVIEIIHQEPVQNEKEARKIMEQFITSLHLKLTLAEYEINAKELQQIKTNCMNQKRFKPEEVSAIIDDLCSGALI